MYWFLALDPTYWLTKDTLMPYTASVYKGNTKPLACELETLSIKYNHYQKDWRTTAKRRVLAKHIHVFVFNKTKAYREGSLKNHVLFKNVS